MRSQEDWSPAHPEEQPPLRPAWWAPTSCSDTPELQHPPSDSQPDDLSAPVTGDEEDDDPASCTQAFDLDLVSLPFAASRGRPQVCVSRFESFYTDKFDTSSRLAGQLCSGALIADGRFEIIEVIGDGSFGVTYRALDRMQGRVMVAVKVAHGRALSPHSAGRYTYDKFLQVELDTYMQLGAFPGSSSYTGIPCIYSAGIHTFQPHIDDGRPAIAISFLAIELVGQSIWCACNKMRQLAAEAGQGTQSEGDPGAGSYPSRAWVVHTAKGMLKALADVHRRGMIHRDVKTENFCLDASNSNDNIYLLDYGFARCSYGHYSVRELEARVATFWGTPNYSSLRALESYPQTPRDDLECLTYCLLEMEQPDGRLPWNKLLTTKEEAQDGWDTEQLQRMHDKKAMLWKAACNQDKVPAYLQCYFNYITSLSPTDIPDYQWLLMVLDSGVTRRLPPRSPHRRTHQALPPPGSNIDEPAYARHAIQHVAAAAASILPLRSNSSSGGSSSGGCQPSGTRAAHQGSVQHGDHLQRQWHRRSQHARAAHTQHDDEHEQQQQPQQPQHKRIRYTRPAALFDGELAPGGGGQHVQGSCGDGAGSDGACVSPEQLVHPKLGGKRQQQVPEPFMSCPMLAGSQTDAEE